MNNPVTILFFFTLLFLVTTIVPVTTMPISMETDPIISSSTSPMLGSSIVPTSVSTVPQISTTSIENSTFKSRPIPSDPLIIGYAHDATSGKVEEAIRNGVNVICWSFVDMVVSSEGEGTKGVARPMIRTNLNTEAINKIRNQEGMEHVLHIAAIGGWNSPHPPSSSSSSSSSTTTTTSFSQFAKGIVSDNKEFASLGEQWCDIFIKFNKQYNNIFDGFDWDLEGQDNVDGAGNSYFTKETLDIMVDMSKVAKLKYGLIVSMAPAESYLDAIAGNDDNENDQSNNSPRQFSYQLNLPPRSYQHNPTDVAFIKSNNFSHAGRQCYAYVLHNAGIDTFDWISLQLYEGYSSFLHETTRQGVFSKDAIVRRAELLNEGYLVKGMPIGSERVRRKLRKAVDDNNIKDAADNGNVSNNDDETETVMIKVPLSKLVIGVANGWADNIKFSQINPQSLEDSYMELNQRFGESYRGAMFWTIDEEGSGGMYMASSLTSVFRRCRTMTINDDRNDEVVDDKNDRSSSRKRTIPASGKEL